MISFIYYPKPTRDWSRVQNLCTDISNNYVPDSVYVPLTKQNIPLSQYDYEKQMLLKGNILQYKKNSSSLTKNQRYTQIAKGMWTNRSKTWATQSDKYTNPNTNSLKRVNYSILDPSNNTFTSPPNPFNCKSSDILDGGNLICNTVVDPCTGAVIKHTISQKLCNPTSSSDVPGPIRELCWNDGYPTWYPRQNYTMNNSGNKFPQGYKGFVSAVTPVPPVLTLVSSTINSVNLSWTYQDNDCIPISSFNVYQNGAFIENILYPNSTTTISNLCGTNTFYVTALSTDIESYPSNIVTFTVVINVPILVLDSSSNNSVTLSWTDTNICINSYTIYNYLVPYENVPNNINTVILSGLCGQYSFSITALGNNYETAHSTPPILFSNTYNAPVLSSSSSSATSVTLSWTYNDICATTVNSYNIYKNAIFLENILYPLLTTTIYNLYEYDTFYVTALVNNNVETVPSNIVNFTGTNTWSQSGGVTTTTGSYTYITFTSGGSFTLTGTINNFQIICAGGGGGGGGGYYNSGEASPFHRGGGGGGGGIGNLTTTLNSGTYNITVGSGGAGGAGQSAADANGYTGSNSTFGSLITSYGGGGGLGNESSYVSGGAAGGSTCALSGFISYTGGDGGGSPSTGNAYNGGNASLTSIPTIGGTYYSFGGGGGGALDVIAYSGGKAGSNGFGGAQGAYTTSPGYGQNATSYGSGGGGASQSNSATSYIGGNGYQGKVILIFLT